MAHACCISVRRIPVTPPFLSLTFCIDRHLVHEVTSPQAFEGLKNASRKIRRPDCTLVTVDHVRESADIDYWDDRLQLCCATEYPYLVTEKLQERRRIH